MTLLTYITDILIYIIINYFSYKDEILVYFNKKGDSNGKL